jgi:CRISPR-associated protein Cas2
MKYLICYDVTETRIRSKMSKYLEGFGHRIQYSVFICEASTEKIVGAKKKLERLAAKSSKRMILILPVCENCASRIWSYGKPIERESIYIVA